ncbi:hypothetical protein [uncultured Methanobrevibacter sp.]|uniref:hypothetical protein n=1 Tax=uncultured Methanobrevibacter sp. TaxID=253161 RepID=UPI0025ED57EB|nr:hypothetical protein [uncultured Methanobrevibacter sp.]
MNTQRKIYESLKKNSGNDSVSNFLQEIFVEENRGLRQWNAKYDELIDKYCKGYLNED